VEVICSEIVAAARRVEPEPQLVAVGLPGHVNPREGTVSGAANLGPEWTGEVPLRDLLQARLGCEVAIRNDAEVALEAEKRHGALVAVNDGALVTLSTGVGVALLVNGEEHPTELGHAVNQFNGPPCVGRPHRGCYESYLGGWALPLRYQERHPEFDGAARDIPNDPVFWNECGTRLGQLVVTLCLFGQRLEAVSFIGPVFLARATLLLPAIEQCVRQEEALLPMVPRRLRVTPLGEDVTVLGALLTARSLLYPFRQA
jgi:predicted NBD/HSP70 family sugar kinase